MCEEKTILENFRKRRSISILYKLTVALNRIKILSKYKTHVFLSALQCSWLYSAQTKFYCIFDRSHLRHNLAISQYQIEYFLLTKSIIKFREKKHSNQEIKYRSESIKCHHHQKRSSTEQLAA